MMQALSPARAAPARAVPSTPRDPSALSALSAARADLDDAARDLAALLAPPASGVVRVQSQRES